MSMRVLRAAAYAAAFLLSVLCAEGARAAAPAQERARALEAHAEALLTDLLGPGRARLFIRSRPGRIEAPEPTALFDRIQARLEEAPPVLPGFPIPRTLKDEILRAYGAPSANSSRDDAPIEATLVIDRSVPEESAHQAEDLLEKALALSPEEGDSLHVVHAAMAARPDPAQASWKDGLPRGAVASLQFLLAAVVLLIAALTALRMAESLPGIRPARPRRNSLLRRLRGSGALMRLLPAPDLADIPRLKPGEASAAASFLAAEPPASAAAALRAFGPAEAAGVLRRMPPSARAALAAELSREPSPLPAPAAPAARRFSWTRAASTPEPLGRRLAERLVEGDREAFLDELFLHLSASEQEEVLAAVDLARPARAHALRGLPTLSAISAAEPTALRTLLSRFSSEELSLAFAGTPDEELERLLSPLPGPIAAAVRDSRPPESAAGERSLVMRGALLSRWRRLVQEGRVPPETA